MKIIADSSLPNLSNAFPKPFELSLYNSQEELLNLITCKQILLCRANLKVTPEIIENSTLNYVATASSGIDHIDTDYLKTKNIKLIDAHGCNKIAVADYVLASIAALQQLKDLIFTKAAVIGVGAVGSLVANRLKNIVNKVILYDPPKSLIEPNFLSAQLTDLQDCDLICIHANLHNDLPYPSNNLINETLLASLKKGVVIINAARGGIVNEKAIVNCQNQLIYCTDVYLNEPFINQEIIDFATLCTPHIAGHSIEAKLNAIAIISKKLHTIYKLPPPSLEILKINPLTNNEFAPFANWQAFVLSLYNPHLETKILKAAQQTANKKCPELADLFLKLRSKHTKRHDFMV